jgi:hypothetical protein
MRRSWLLPLLSFLATACGSTSTAPSSLQRFDALRGRLEVVTRASSRLASDESHVRAALAHGAVASVRRWTGRARIDAHALSAGAGAAGGPVRALAASAPAGSAEQRYLVLIEGALGQQWIEGRRMSALSSLLWHDPLLVSPSDVASAMRLQRQAVRSASSAVADVLRASRIRKSRWSAFRYVPVRLAGAASSGN